MKAILALEDGRTFEGCTFGAIGETSGEVVFNTSMTGYQEILTDPSYAGQIVVMTYPHIGNYGTNEQDEESPKPFVEGFAAREFSTVHSNWRARQSLEGYLLRHNIVAISEVDTRAVVRHIRTRGALRGIISSADLDTGRLVERARAVRSMLGSDLASSVCCNRPYGWSGPADAPEERPFKVVAYDYGIKHNILNNLTRAACDVVVVPGRKPDGQGADLRHLPGTPTHGPGFWRENVQTEIRPPRGEPARKEPSHRAGRNNRAEPWVCRGPRFAGPEPRRVDASESERPHAGGHAP